MRPADQPEHTPRPDAFQVLFENAGTMVCTLDPGGRITSLNRAGERLTGYPAEELVGLEAIHVIAPEARAEAVEQFRRRFEDGAGRAVDETVLLTRDARRIPVEVTSIQLAANGRPPEVEVLGIVRDLSEQRRAAEALHLSEERFRASEQRFRSSFESAPIGMALVAPDGRFIQVNEELCRLTGYPADALVALTFQDITHPDDLEADLDLVRQVLAGEIRTYQLEKRYFHRDGHVVWILLSVSLVRAGDGTPLHFISQIQDITERKRSQEELERSERRLAEAEKRYRRLVEQLPLGTYIRPLDLTKPNIYASPQVEPMLGYAAEDWQTNPDMLQTVVHPDDRERVLGAASHVRSTGEATHDEYRIIARDGRVVWVQDETYISHDDAGNPAYVQGFLLDITNRKRAEAERDRLRDELHHAQKLEALGRLAGGVAHDFNNMLTGIRGYAELLLERLEPESPLRGDVQQISRAVEQASTLPRQLLAFGRKQVIQPDTVDLDEVVTDASDLLRRVVTGAVELTSVPSERPSLVVADSGQLEQVLLNLAVNARDAMPTGGALTIRTERRIVGEETAAEHDVASGPYVVLSVSDTGHGMDEETLARAFEPFFTTKPSGLGSGLGLASVYGIVRQSGGYVTVESAVGRGTTFEVFLPCAADGAETRRAPAPSQPTVLLAEDEAIVRELTTETLERAGYRVLAANDGAEALEVFDRLADEIDAVVTDMVMPGLAGRELAERVLARRPGLPIVFISGYTEEAPPADLGSEFLHKPFSTRRLTEAVAGALSQPGAGGAEAAASPASGGLTCVMADDHPAILHSVSRYLERCGIEIVARACRGDDAVAAIEEHQPKVALLDVSMESVSGIEIVEHLARSGGETRPVLYTGRPDPVLLREAMAAGAKGFVLKETELSELARALAVVADGGTYVDAALSEALTDADEQESAAPTLTPREREVLALVADGFTNERVAEELEISAETVQSHVRNAMARLGADTRTQAVATALRHSLIL